MTSARFPYSFSDGLASPDMAVDVIHAPESESERFARKIAAMDGIMPGNSAYTLVTRAVKRTMQSLSNIDSQGDL